MGFGSVRRCKRIAGDTYEAIVKGENIPDPGIPESFKVLIKELQSLALDVKVLSPDKEEIIVRDSTDDEADYNEIMQAEREDRKTDMHNFKDEDEINLGSSGESSAFTDEDDDFSLDSLFDEDESSLADLFGDEDKADEPEDEENLNDDGLDSLLDAIGGDDDDLFGDEDDEDEDDEDDDSDGDGDDNKE